MGARLFCAALAGLTLGGCYLAHGAGPDVSLPDAGVRDGGARDGGARDAGARDAGVRDAATPACAFELRSRARLSWLSDAEGCSGFTAPFAVADGDRVHLVATEQRSCRDRPAFVVASPARVRGDALEVPPALVTLDFGTNGRAAVTSDRFGICTGLDLSTMDADYRIIGFGVPLAETPVPIPGCPLSLACGALAGADGQWLVQFDGFDCDVFETRMATASLDGLDVREILHTFETIDGVTADGDGFAWLSRPRGDRPTSTLWRWSRGALRELTLPIAGSVAAVTAGPEAGQLVLLYARLDESTIVRLEVLVVDAGNEVIARHELRAFTEPMGGFDVQNLSAASTPFGIVIATSLAWTGGAIHGGLSVLAIDADGTPLGAPFEHFDEAGAGGTASVAAVGDDVIVHHDVNDHLATEALLFGCR